MNVAIWLIKHPEKKQILIKVCRNPSGSALRVACSPRSWNDHLPRVSGNGLDPRTSGMIVLNHSIAYVICRWFQRPSKTHTVSTQNTELLLNRGENKKTNWKPPLRTYSTVFNMLVIQLHTFCGSKAAVMRLVVEGWFNYHLCRSPENLW